ncbi:MAG: carboxypeptidase regulatory-like domain-containing protein [Verrucomicrobia bacterium]|nr:MAG: carboxypeptidase regulatory-like domain-containing protein [Verrucomicrobiota bacterium]
MVLAWILGLALGLSPADLRAGGKETLSASELQALKQQIKREVLAELCQQLGDAAAEVNQAHERLKQEIKREVLEELRRELLESPKPAPGVAPAPPSGPSRPSESVAAPAPRPPTPAPAAAKPAAAKAVPGQVTVEPPVEFGDAEGRILWKGKPLPGCRVRLVRLESSGFLLLRSVKHGVEFETVTDEQGRYRFRHIPTGDYKLKWLTPGSNGWVRRLRDGPDVTVTAGKTARLKDVEAGIAPVAVGRGS